MSLWTTQQHEWLQALGHPVLLLAGDPALAESAPIIEPPIEPATASNAARMSPASQPVPDALRAAQPGHPSSQDANRRLAPVPVARPSRPAPVANPIDAAPATSAAAAPRPPTDAAAKKAALDEARRAGQRSRVPQPAAVADPLFDAILRAVGPDEGAARETLTDMAIDLPRLRADPRAKRTLWIRLRTLRRGRDT
ncbi:MAG: hypothetical protein ACOH1P_09530 [Lysobacter sp.]